MGYNLIFSYLATCVFEVFLGGDGKLKEANLGSKDFSAFRSTLSPFIHSVK